MKRLAPLALLLLSACAGTDAVSQVQPAGYLRDAAELVAAADWSAPETLTVRIPGYRFTPDEMVFHRDRPTRLVLVNETERNHSFVAKAFFQGIAVKQLSGPGGTMDGPWVERVLVPAGETKELWFVPARYGSYKFECDITGHSALGMSGLIDVR